MRKIGILLLSLVLILTSGGMMSGIASATSTVTNTGALGTWPDVSGSIIVFETREIDIGEDLNGDGDTDDTVIRYYDISTGSLVNTGAAGVTQRAVSGSIIAFETDCVIRYYDISTGSLVNTVAAGDSPSVSGSIIAFRTYEGWIGEDLNGDGDTIDCVIRYYDISTGSLVNTGVTGNAASVSGSIIVFDGWWDHVIRYYDISTGSLVNTGVDGCWCGVSGSIIAFHTWEGLIGEDLNGDGDTDDAVIRYYEIPPPPTIETISNEVDAFLADRSIDNEGIAKALHSFLEQAQAMINRDNITAAKNILNAFIHLVDAQSGKHITTDAAQILIDSAQAEIDSL